MMEIMIMMKRMMIMKGGREGTPGGGAGAGRGSSAGPRWAADLESRLWLAKSNQEQVGLHPNQTCADHAPVGLRRSFSIFGFGARCLRRNK